MQHKLTTVLATESSSFVNISSKPESKAGHEQSISYPEAI